MENPTTALRIPHCGTPRVMGVENLTASEFLKSAQSAAGNMATKPAFREIELELSRSPQTRRRLAFEFLAMAARLVAAGQDPAEAILWATRWRESVGPESMAQYLGSLEKILVDYFEALKHATPGTPTEAWAVTLAWGLMAVGDSDQDRFSRLLADLRQRCCLAPLDLRPAILLQVDQILAYIRKKRQA